MDQHNSFPHDFDGELDTTPAGGTQLTRLLHENVSAAAEAAAEDAFVFAEDMTRELAGYLGIREDWAVSRSRSLAARVQLRGPLVLVTADAATPVPTRR